jgi:spore germination cell wall hydrolase CwlJ-like protein
MKYTSLAIVLVVTTLSISIAGNTRSETAMNDTEAFGSNQLYTSDTHPEEFCLAQNIYYESRIDNLAGQAAVADVVLNRVNDRRYPTTICEVVKEGPISKWWKEEKNKEVPIRDRCQFSWYCDGKPDDQPEGDKWKQAQELAYKMIHQDYMRGISEGATHYHATYVNPKWNRNMHLIGRIGLHIFYVSR